MVLRDATRERLEFARQRRLRAPVLVGIGFVILALLPLLGPGPVSATRLAAAVGFAAAAALLIGSSRPRVERFHISLEDGVLASAGRQLPLSRVRRVVLVGRPGSDRSAEQRYAADLLLDDGRLEPFLENTNPARVLEDLGKVLARLDLPVELGWGLDEGTRPWAPDTPSRPPTRVSLSAAPHPSQRPAAITVLVGGSLTALLMVIFTVSRWEEGKHVSSLSLGLAATMVGIILAVGVLLVTDRVNVRSNGSLIVERRVLGRLWWRTEVHQLSGAHAVGPEPDSPQHVLLETNEGLLAVPFVGPAAVELARALSQPGADA